MWPTWPHTPTLGLIDCPLSSSNMVDMKYSQVLTQTITTCTAIRSSSIIFSSNTSLLLKSRCDKNEPHRWQVEWQVEWNLKKKNEMRLPNPKNIQITWHSPMKWKTWNFQMKWDWKKRGKKWGSLPLIWHPRH